MGAISEEEEEKQDGEEDLRVRGVGGRTFTFKAIGKLYRLKRKYLIEAFYFMS